MVSDPRPAFMMNLRFPIGAVTDASLTIQGDNVADIAMKTIEAMTAFQDNIAQATAARHHTNGNGRRDPVPRRREDRQRLGREHSFN